MLDAADQPIVPVKGEVHHVGLPVALPQPVRQGRQVLAVFSGARGSLMRPRRGWSRHVRPKEMDRHRFLRVGAEILAA